MIQYYEDGDVAVFDNLVFRRDKKTGYYSATQRNAKSKISKKFNENSNNINKEKKQNCDIF